MSDPIMGRDVVVEVILATASGSPVDGVYAAPSTGWLALGGTRGLSKGAEWDTVDTTSRSTPGNVRAATVTYLSTTGNIDGLYLPETAANVEATDDYVNDPTSGQPHAWIRLTYPSATAGTFTRQALYCTLTSFNIEAPHDDAMTFDMAYTGKQPWLKSTYTPTP